MICLAFGCNGSPSSATSRKDSMWNGCRGDGCGARRGVCRGLAGLISWGRRRCRGRPARRRSWAYYRRRHGEQRHRVGIIALMEPVAAGRAARELDPARQVELNGHRRRRGLADPVDQALEGIPPTSQLAAGARNDPWAMGRLFAGCSCSWAPLRRGSAPGTSGTGLAVGLAGGVAGQRAVAQLDDAQRHVDRHAACVRRAGWRCRGCRPRGVAITQMAWPKGWRGPTPTTCRPAGWRRVSPRPRSGGEAR